MGRLLLLLLLTLLHTCSAFPPNVSSGRLNGGSNTAIADADADASGSSSTARFTTCGGSRRGCTSNSTHIGWPTVGGSGGDGDNDCAYQTWAEATSDCVEYLGANLMPFDVPNAGTLGFPPSAPAVGGTDKAAGASGSSAASAESVEAEEARRTQQRPGANSRPEAAADPLPDGLSDGIVNRTVHLALLTKVRYPWTARIPRPIFNEYVLNFANANEARTNWRPLLTDAVKPTMERLLALHAQGQEQEVRIEDVVKAINQDLWVTLGKYDRQTNSTVPIHFVSGQTPLIFDAMSVVAFGFGSCTGLSILFVNALRAAGVPARLAGTPAWNGEEGKGNHNWVEVWTPLDDDGGAIAASVNDGTAAPGRDNSGGCHENDGDCGGRWHFLEPSCGDFGDKADNLERDPCQRWFCNTGRFDGTTRVYAARYDRGGSSGEGAGVVYPLAWDPGNLDVPGVDRTAYYTEVAQRCANGFN